MDAKALNASMAYVQALKNSTAGAGMEGGDAIGKAAGGAGGESFADMLKNAAEGVADTARHSEAMTMQAAAKKAELVDVVTAVTNAEVALQAVVAVRDKVVQAYQDVMRMPI